MHNQLKNLDVYYVKSCLISCLHQPFMRVKGCWVSRLFFVFTWFALRTVTYCCQYINLSYPVCCLSSVQIYSPSPPNPTPPPLPPTFTLFSPPPPQTPHPHPFLPPSLCLVLAQRNIGIIFATLL